MTTDELQKTEPESSPAVDELRAVFRGLLATDRAQLRRADPLVAEESVDAARLPVSRITGIDDDDFVQVARQP